MGRVAKMLIVAALLLSPELVQAWDGTTWRSFSEHVRASYVIGVVETWHNITLIYEREQEVRARPMTATEKHFADLAQCVIKRGMKGAQVVAIVEKYVNDHPDQWNYEMTSIVRLAMYESCKK